MITLGNIQTRYKRSKRVGRGIGSGKGKTCGRGHKGAKSRAGYKVRMGNEGGQVPMYRRIPIRGFSNGRFATKVCAINIGLLEKVFANKSIVTIDSLKEKRLIPTKRNIKVKLLGNGVLKKSLDVTVNGVSASARKKIEDAKGKVICV